MPRRQRIEPERALQVGFLVLLAVCVGQVLWWIIDEVQYTQEMIDVRLTHHARDAELARTMVEMGLPREFVLEQFENLVAVEGPALVAVDPAFRARLEEARHQRLDRFGWEGAFFLLVLIAGVLVLARAMRADTSLRHRQQNFVAAVSHELKSPLASLRLSAETLLYRELDDERRRTLARRLVDDLDRLDTMVGNILDTARIEEGELRLEPSRVGVADVVRTTAREFAERAREVGVTLETEVDEGLEILADPVAVRSVLRNLLDNAIKATEARDGGRVRIAATREGRFVRVAVADDGVGFPPEEAGNLFKKFYRPGDEMKRRSRGSGLGLYLVQRFVQLEGGRVDAESAGPGRGATISASWPAAEEPA